MSRTHENCTELFTYHENRDSRNVSRISGLHVYYYGCSQPKSQPGVWTAGGVFGTVDAMRYFWFLVSGPKFLGMASDCQTARLGRVGSFLPYRYRYSDSLVRRYTQYVLNMGIVHTECTVVSNPSKMFRICPRFRSDAIPKKYSCSEIYCNLQCK
jgi:hypothetical protein